MKALKNVSNLILESVIFAGFYFLSGLVIVPFLIIGAVALCYFVSLFSDKL